MATTSNGNGNLVDEFEEAFQACLNALTKEDALHHMDKEETRAEADQTINRVLDLARQTEAFFLQKRFLLSALKPELIVKEDIIELRAELLRKEELIKRHYEKINQWQNLLSDLRSAQAQGNLGQGPSAGNNMPQQGPPMGQPNGIPHGPSGVVGVPGGGGISGNLQQLQHQQQHQMQLQQQQQMQQMQMQQQQLQHQQMQQMQMQQQVPGMGGGMVSPQQAMFMGGGARGPPFPGNSVLQGPLAYLEKTTSNIGMTDGRR